MVITPPQKFAPGISSGYKVFRRYTRFTSLKVRDAPAGSVITVTCSGKQEGLPVQEGQAISPERQLAEHLQPLVQEGEAAAAAATVVVRVSSPSGDRKQMTFKIRSRKLPVRTTRCSAAGGKLGKCA